jgi:hypothetical protein
MRTEEPRSRYCVRSCLASSTRCPTTDSDRICAALRAYRARNLRRIHEHGGRFQRQSCRRRYERTHSPSSTLAVHSTNHTSQHPRARVDVASHTSLVNQARALSQLWPSVSSRAALATARWVGTIRLASPHPSISLGLPVPDFCARFFPPSAHCRS